MINRPQNNVILLPVEITQNTRDNPTRETNILYIIMAKLNIIIWDRLQVISDAFERAVK